MIRIEQGHPLLSTDTPQEINVKVPHYCLSRKLRGRKQLHIAGEPEDTIHPPVNYLGIKVVPERAFRYALFDNPQRTGKVGYGAYPAFVNDMVILSQVSIERRTHVPEMIARKPEQFEDCFDYIL